MTIKALLAKGHVVIDAPAADKSSVLSELSRRAAAAAGLPADVITNEIKRRDELGSTGIGSGVAIPHARLSEVTKTVGFFARLARPIPFDAIDGQPVDIVFLLLLPAGAQLDQLNALAAVARKLRDPDVLHKIRTAQSSLAVYQVLTA